MTDGITLAALVYALAEAGGIATALHAVLHARTSQGSVAWAIALVTMPLISLPLYGLIGGRKFRGYIKARRAGDSEIQRLAAQVAARCGPEVRAGSLDGDLAREPLERLARLPFFAYSDARLLIDGTQTFDAICEAIASAREYVLLQFYIVRDDGLGRRLRDLLVERLQAGVRIYFLYDAVGSHALPGRYAEDLRRAGARMLPFLSTRRPLRRLQVNFRNHRKIVVADGRTAFVGGHNVGDEYLGLDPALSPWRDTHVALQGPVVLGVQLAFLEDWHWAAGELPELRWEPEIVSSRGCRALVLPTGPVDTLDNCGLFFVHAINSARRRIWITSPYFVPDEAVVSALQLAALRGVDVRILLPGKADHLLVHLASFSYIVETRRTGIRLFRYRRGFLHQKVMLVDDDVAAVGTANLDNRSFRLNFEITVLFADRGFARDVAGMLERDFAASDEIGDDERAHPRLALRVASGVARLFSPVL